jgi:transketolase
LYVVLADRGFYGSDELETLCRYQSHFVGHPTRKVPGIEQNTGALGHGLSMCVGMAVAAKLDQANYRVMTLVGDGELAEGSNWEAAMLAAHYRLDNLTAIVDHNRLQISGRTRDVCDNAPLDQKFTAFGWNVKTVDGHDLVQLRQTLTAAPVAEKPTAVIANTVKGKGVSFMEDAAQWHHGVPNDDQYERAFAEVETAISELEANA